MSARGVFPIPRSWVPKASPNHGPRPAGARVSALVLHADASRTVDATLGWLARRESGVSYHILIGRTGTVFLVVPPERRAWHAGRSALAGVGDCNDFTVGVCLSNDNAGEPFPPPQLNAAAGVCRLLLTHFGLDARAVTTHALIALPAGRKTDPAPPFDLAAFRARLA